jgi:hypothetical protein
MNYEGEGDYGNVMRTHDDDPGNSHLQSWFVETSADGKRWRKVGREEDNEQLNDRLVTGTLVVAGSGECRFIRLVNIGRNHGGNDKLNISVWEIFERLVESTSDSSDAISRFLRCLVPQSRADHHRRVTGAFDSI